MSRVDEIQAAIEYPRIIQWFGSREQRGWDEQSDADSAAGELAAKR